MTNFGSWGRFPPTHQTAHQPRFLDEIPGILSNAEKSLTLAYGNGRSYGDSCLASGGIAIGTRKLDRILSFDPESGRIRCESGVLLDRVIKHVLPQGWFPAVTPGTRFITLGGAIANDVHGKNHHALGSFGDHVISFEILTSDGRKRNCSRSENVDWFFATIGGLGLTGIITTVDLQLREVSGPWMRTESVRFKRIEDFFEISRESKNDWEYTVAWIDCLASGPNLGRGVFFRANHAMVEEKRRAPSARRLTIPFSPPVSLVESWSVGPFNALYYYNAGRKKQNSYQHYSSFFYPLDEIEGWNRLYGPAGFQQFQCVLPPLMAEEGCKNLLRVISSSNVGSFLAVLKQFGDDPASGWISFPRPGTTLALDFANHGAATSSLFQRLTDAVEDLGGAIYPAKDAQMSASSFRAAFPKWLELEGKRDPHICSMFWRRVALEKI